MATLVIAALGLSACGSSSDNQATTLLHQTFTGNHRINSGILGFSVAITPSGSSALTAPTTSTRPARTTSMSSSASVGIRPRVSTVAFSPSVGGRKP